MGGEIQILIEIFNAKVYSSKKELPGVWYVAAQATPRCQVPVPRQNVPFDNKAIAFFAFALTWVKSILTFTTLLACIPPVNKPNINISLYSSHIDFISFIFSSVSTMAALASKRKPNITGIAERFISSYIFTFCPLTSIQGSY